MDWLTEWFVVHFHGKAIVRIQNPVVLSEYSEPEPDVALVSLSETRYLEQHPGPDEVLLLIEVADTSLEKDRNVKVPLYACAGIPEVWLVNLIDKSIEQHTQPSPEGFNSIRIFRRGQVLKSDLTPALLLDDLFG